MQNFSINCWLEGDAIANTAQQAIKTVQVENWEQLGIDLQSHGDNFFFPKSFWPRNILHLCVILIISTSEMVQSHAVADQV